MGTDLNVVGAAQVAQVRDRGSARRGSGQGELDLLSDATIAIRDGRIVAVGPTAEVLGDHGDDVPTIDGRGKTVLPGLVECHSHPLFGGERCHEYAERLGGASLSEVAARGGGIWSSIVSTREASDADLVSRLADAYARIAASGVTTLEVKSGYGLTTEHELHQLELLEASRAATPMQLVVTFLGAHIVPRDLVESHGAAADEVYTRRVCDEMLPAVLTQGIAQFHDVTVEDGLFTPDQAMRLMAASREARLPVRVHADAWKPSRGWSTAVAGGAVSAEHLTYTPDGEIAAVGATDCVAVLLPVAELVYMTDRRANARLLIDHEVPVAIATDHCSSIHATSLLSTMALAAPWFRLTPGEVIVASTLNAAYSLGLQDHCGSIDVGKRGDLVILDCAHPDELFLAVGNAVLDTVVTAGQPTHQFREGFGPPAGRLERPERACEISP
jgi:imidazolonepropionase